LSEYVIMRNTGVKIIMNKMVEDYTITNEETIQLENELQNINQIQVQLEQHFDFEIPKYIAVDIADNETYQHVCLMINLATVNDRLSEENAATLKKGIKELFNVKNKYDNVESRILINKF